MIKVKILSLLLSVTLLFFAVIPAHAAEDTFNVNLLDYCTPNNSGDLYVTVNANKQDVTFSNDLGFIGYYIDILCYFYGELPSAVNFVSASGTTLIPLTLTRLDSNLYRIQGNTSGYLFANFALRFTVSNTLQISFMSFNISTFRSDSYPETGKVTLETYGYSPTINYNPSDAINGRTWTGYDDYTDNFISAKATLDDWKLYDWWDSVFFLACSDINSITVTQGSNNIPFEVSVIGNPSWIINDYYISISVDLSACNKRINDAPTVHIEASAAPGESNTFTVISMAGVVRIYDTNSLSYWLQRIHIKLDGIADPIVDKLEFVRNSINRQLDNVITAIRGNSSAADDFNSESADKNEQLQDMVGIMDSVSRPDINQLNPSLSIQNSGADIAGGIGPVLTVPMQNPIILQVLILSLTFVMIAYVLYGKR